MFDGRIYRAAFVPLLLALAITGFSLTNLPAPLSSTLAPDAFNGPRAFAGLQALVKRFPNRRPGSAEDNELALYIAQQLREMGSPPTSGPTPSGPLTSAPSTPGAAGGGFQVSTRQIHAATIDGERTLTTVIAERPGSTDLSPIAIVAHRDAAAPGSAAELSGTAALLELARVFSQSETRRTIVLVSTSGGSGGYAGAADFARDNAPAARRRNRARRPRRHTCSQAVRAAFLQRSRHRSRKPAAHARRRDLPGGGHRSRALPGSPLSSPTSPFRSPRARRPR